MIEIPATSTCVLSLLSQNSYQGRAAKAFMKKLDLSSGAPILAHFEDLLDEIQVEILNRRHGVEKCCYEYLSENPSAQVIHLGCGLDPLPMDLAECYPEASFFDVDMAHRGLKERINKQIGGPDVNLMTADLTDIPIVLSELNRAGWNLNIATLLVSEGISYYIPKESYRDLLRCLQTPNGAIVFEYSATDSQLYGTQKSELISEFFVRLARILNLPFPLQRYEDNEIKSLSKYVNGNIVSIMTQQQLELSRLGTKMTRKNPSMGAIRVAYIRFVNHCIKDD